jgi:hypothetical protein
MTRPFVLRFAKTSIGDAELCRPAVKLPLSARALLAVVDQATPIELCLARACARLSDAVLLLTYHLIHETSLLKQDGLSKADVSTQCLIEALLAMDGEELYAFLTEHCKHHLGLLQGFRMILALEHCEVHQERQALAIRFIDLTWHLRGSAGLRSLARLLERDIKKMLNNRH